MLITKKPEPTGAIERLSKEFVESLEDINFDDFKFESIKRYRKKPSAAE